MYINFHHKRYTTAEKGVVNCSLLLLTVFGMNLEIQTIVFASNVHNILVDRIQRTKLCTALKWHSAHCI